MGGPLGGAGGVVEPGLLGALVGQQEAQVGLVGIGGGDAGVHIHIVIQGDIIVALGGDGHVPLAQHGVDEAVDEGAVVVVLLHDQIRGVHIIHPGGYLLIVLALAGDGVAQYSALDVGAAEQADGLDDPGGDPPGLALLIDLKLGGGEHEGGVLEAQVAHDIAVKRLREGVLHPFLLGQADHLGLLGDHVHDHIGGQAAAPVGEPLDQVGIGDGGDPDRAALVVDLGGVIGVLKLADHVAEGTHLAVAQVVGAVPVQGGDLTEGDLADVLGELPVLHRQQIPVGSGPEDGHGDHLAHQGDSHQEQQEHAHRQALLLDEAEVLPDLFLGRDGFLLPLEAGGDQGRDHIDHAQQDHEAVKIVGLEVESGEGDVEVGPSHSQSDQQVGQDLPRLAGRYVQLFLGILTQNNILLCPAEAAGRNRNTFSIPFFRLKSNSKEERQE